MITTPNADQLNVELDAPLLTVEPGGAPVTLSLRIENRSSIVDRFSVHVAWLDPDWFTLSSSVVALFPGDTEQIELRILPPLRRPDLRAGAYPFQVSVRSAGGGASRSVDGELTIRGEAVFHLELLPQRRVSHGRARFVVRVTNNGLAAGGVALEARDAEDGLHFNFRADQSPLVDAGQSLDMPLDVTPVRRPFVGPQRSYAFQVTATPRRSDGLAEPMFLAGTLVHQPRLPSLALLWRVARWSLVPLLAVAAFNLVPLPIRCAVPGNGPDVMVLGEGCPRPVVAPPAPLQAPLAAQLVTVPPVIAAQPAPLAALVTQAAPTVAPAPPQAVPTAPAVQAPAAPQAAPTAPALQIAAVPPVAQVVVPPAPTAPPAPVAQPTQQPTPPAQPTAPPAPRAAPPQVLAPPVQPPARPQAPLFDIFATACGPTPLKQPSALAVDRQANLFIADTDNNRLVKLSPKGVCMDQWQIDHPARFALDAQGTTAYLTDTINSRLLKLSLPSRKLETLASTGRLLGQVDHPAGIIVDKDNNLVIADFGNNRVQKLSPQGKPLLQWNVKGASDVALETDGDVYATGAGANATQTLVLKLTRDGKSSTILTSTTPLEIGSDEKGTVLGSTVSDLRKLSDENQTQTVTRTFPNGQFTTPPSFATDDQGKLFVLNTAAGQVLTPRPGTT